MRNRREVLKAVGTGMATAAAMAAMSVHATPIEVDALLLDLERQLLEATTRSEQLSREADVIEAAYPAHLLDGLPRWDRTNPLFKNASFATAADRNYHGSLFFEDIRTFNRSTEAIARGNLLEYAKRREEGRERIRWWIRQRREQLRVREESGYRRVMEELDAVVARLCVLQSEIVAQQAHSLDGLFVKIRLAKRLVIDDHALPEEVEAIEAGDFDKVETMYMDERLAAGIGNDLERIQASA